MLLLTADGVMPMDPAGPEAPETVALAGDDLVLHRIMLADADPKRRMEEARMRATDLAAQPVDTLHLALGSTLPDGSAWLALMARDRLEERLGMLAALGHRPVRMVPAAMLLPEPAGEVPSVAMDGDLAVLRGRDVAGSVEPALAEALGAPATGHALARAIDPALADLAPNLLTGAFAPRRRWWRERPFQLAAAGLLLLALLLAMAPWLVARQQMATAVSGHDAATVALAARLPGAPFADAPAAATALAEARSAREAGMVSARLSALAAAMADLPRARVEAMQSDAAGHLTLTLAGPADAINQLRARLETGAFEAGGEGTVLTLGARQGARSVSGDAIAVALARRYNAARDAAILAALPRSGAAPESMAALLAEAGLEPAPAESGASAIQLPAARPAVLLPLIARLEQQGARFARIEIVANEDQSVRALLVRAP